MLGVAIPGSREIRHLTVSGHFQGKGGNPLTVKTCVRWFSIVHDALNYNLMDFDYKYREFRIIQILSYRYL